MPDERCADQALKDRVKTCDSLASTHAAQDIFQVRTEVTDGLPVEKWNTPVEHSVNEVNEITEVQVKIEDPEPAKDPKEDEVEVATEREWTFRKKLLMAWYLAMTVVYFVYRSQEISIFTPAAFELRWQDSAGLLFALSFLMTRKPSYLIYAINPFRNVLLVMLQAIFPELSERRTNPEYYRNICSASIQLCCGCAIWFFTTPQPIGDGTSWALQMPCLDGPCLRERRPCFQKWFIRVVNSLLLLTGIAATVIALEEQTDSFRTLHTEDHGWKIILSIVLGISEEVSWRSVYMADNNNSIQAFTWGMNHVVAGTGIDNPWVYGIVSAAYAFLLGVSPSVGLRCFNHAAVEYFVIDNLVKPEGHPIWLPQSVSHIV